MEQQENELEQARREIDAVDAEMAALFCRRMDAVRRVAAYKQARGLPVLDASREEAVVAKNCARLPDEAYAEYYEDFIRHTMGLSRAFQRAVLGLGTVAYQGVEGAFSTLPSPACPACTGAGVSHLGGGVRRCGRRRRGLRRAAL